MHLLLLHRLRLYGAGRWGNAFSINKKNALIFTRRAVNEMSFTARFDF
jgi:hypothetical protein